MGFFGWVKPPRTLNGIGYEVKFTKRKKNRTGTLSISVAAQSHAEFEVVRESNLAGFAKVIGLSKELQTGDKDFDNYCYIRTDSPRFSGALLQNQAVRSHIQSLLGSGFNSVRHDGKRVSVTKSNAIRSDEDNAPLLESAVRELHPISEQIKNTRALGEDHSVSGAAKGTIAYTAGIGSLIAGFVLMIAGQSSFEPINSWPFFLDSLNYSATIFILYAFGMYLFLRGRSRSHIEFLTTFFTALVGIPLLTFGVMLFLNGRNDPGPAAEHNLLIIDKYTSRNKNKTNYKIKYQSWQPGAGEQVRGVSSAEYSRITAGQSHILITTKPGNLGYEWIEKINY